MEKNTLDNGKKFYELSKQGMITIIKCCFCWYFSLSMHERHNIPIIWVVVNAHIVGQW